jgi:hypothetical protein
MARHGGAAAATEEAQARRAEAQRRDDDEKRLSKTKKMRITRRATPRSPLRRGSSP